MPFMSTYERLYGGTTLHWLGTCLRMLPNDFRTKSEYGWGRDWPLAYNELRPYYERAEKFLAVRADVRDQIEAYGHDYFSPDYQYPAVKIPQTYADKQLANGVEGLELFELPVAVTSTPQGRGPSCMGSTSCIPFCPMGSTYGKYDATRTLNALRDDPNNNGKFNLVTQAVATKVKVNADGKVCGIEYQIYERQDKSPTGAPKTAIGTVYVLAAHAIETPRLLLNSATKELPNGVANSSDQVGRNLMDHTVYLAWGLTDEPNYPFRGARSTSGIETLRDGPFRNQWAASRVDIGNEGWGWADNDPMTLVSDLVDGTNISQLNPQSRKYFGKELAEKINYYMTRMVRLCFLVEQDPDPNNRITLSKQFKDGMGIPRPEIFYQLSDYTKKGFVKAKQTAEAVFKQAKIQPYTQFHDEDGYPSFEYNDGESLLRYNAFGAGHIVGTFRMGSQKSDSVVDSYQRSWDHSNLFLLGSGTFPTIATGNPTLTIAALTLRTAKKIIEDLA